MSYIGNQPAEKYTTFAKQDFTVTATTSYTLDHSVANENEIALFINFVRQEPTTAYTASGTSLTLTEATSVSDNMYCVFIGKAVQTVTPADNTITNAMLTSGSFSNITGTGTLTSFASTGIDDNATSTAITIDSNEKIGIGVTPDSWTTSYSNEAVNIGDIGSLGTFAISTGDRRFEIGNNVYWGTDNARKYRTTGAKANFIQLAEGDFTLFGTNSTGTADNNITFTEGMRVRPTGQTTIGTTTVQNNATLTVYGNGVGQIACEASAVSNGFTAIFFRNPNGVQGQIATNSTSVSYQTTSDHRLKENVVSMTNATDRLKQLKPKRFNFIADADTTVDGFLAHEVQSVVPEAISGTHNEVDADGNPVYQGIDQAKLVPVLTKALQEAITKIEELETRIQTLEDA